MNAMNPAVAEPAAPATTATPREVARVRVWDLPVRVFHWALASAFAAAYVLSESERLRQVHVMFGYTVLGLVAFRLVWGFVGTHFARFSSFLFAPGATWRYLRSLAAGRPEHHLGHNPAGSWAIWAILGLATATGVTGYLTFNEFGGDAVEELHEGLANAWLAVVFVHVAGVIASSVLHRENLASAMLTGYKRLAPGASASVADVPARVAVGLLGALVVGAFWITSLLAGGAPGAGPTGGDRETAAASSGEEGGSEVSAMASRPDDDDD